MRSRLRTTAAVIASAALALAGCGSDGDAEGSGGSDGATRTFAADNGKIEIPEKPERVVATGYAVPVMLEADAPLVGISTWSRGTELMTKEDLAEYEDLAKVAGDDAASTNYDSIAKADPDLIVIGVPLPVLEDINMDRLEDIAPVVVLGPDRPDDWKELGKKQSDAAGVIGSYEENQAAYEKKAGELTKKYAAALKGKKFGHLGGYGDVSAGTFQREFSGSWGTNIAEDVGVEYYGKVKDPSGGGSDEVSETPALEELPTSFKDADYITYTGGPKGKTAPSVTHVLSSKLWKGLPAVKGDHVIGLQNTEAATYTSAMETLDAIDTAFSKAFADDLK